MFTLTQSNLATVPAAKKDDDGCYDMRSLKVDILKKKVYVTNGHSLYSSNLEGYQEDGQDADKEIYLPAVYVTKAEKNIKKGETLEVYTTDNFTRLSVDHGKMQDVVKFETEEGKFPDVERIFSAVEGEPTVQTVLGVEELEILVKVLKKAGAGCVRLKMYSRTGPVKFEAESVGIEGITMPWVLSPEEREEEREQKRRAAKELA